MKLDELLKQSATWLEHAKKRRVFDKVDENATKFTEEQLARRKLEIETRIGALARRKEDTIASFDRAIANEKIELEALRTQKSAVGVPEPTKRGVGTGKKSKAKRP
jgi:hypothetical protein